MLNSLQLQQFISREGGFEKDQIQQVSIDLTLAHIATVEDGGHIFKDRKAQLPQYSPIKPVVGLESRTGFYLQPGYYALEFNESTTIPLNRSALVLHRSSLLRCGVDIKSALFDPGFNGQLGAFAIIHKSIFIELGARIACVYGFHSDEIPSEMRYQGTYQR